ncbi:MAG: DUF1573 domain-containing protein [Desulfobacteraceae bacterium]|nr:MAG: DUF1573 domain-containing protein [Desulfobacteraceae bacterium]
MQTQWKHTALGAVLIVLLIGSGAAARFARADAAAQGNEPRAVFPETRHEFGSVMEGQEVRHDFVVENRGQADLIIQRVQPD